MGFFVPRDIRTGLYPQVEVQERTGFSLMGDFQSGTGFQLVFTRRMRVPQFKLIQNSL